MKLCVIHLDREVARRERLEARFHALGMEVEFFPAIDARAGEHLIFSHYDEKACRREGRKPFTPAEIACFASHYRLWEACVADRQPYVILEDNAIISDIFPYFYKKIPKILEKVSYIRLESFEACPYDLLPFSVLEGDNIHIASLRRGALGSAAYAVTPQGARCLLDHARHWTQVVDRYLHPCWKHGLPSLAVVPAPISQDKTLTALIPIYHQRAPLGTRLKQAWRRLWDNVARRWFHLKASRRWRDGYVCH